MQSVALKRKCLHFDEIFITGCTESCQNDNFQCSQWWKFRQNDDISVSVCVMLWLWILQISFNTWRPRWNGRHFADDIFLNENVWISLKISLAFVPKFRINNIPALVMIMAWRSTCATPLPEPLMVNLLTHMGKHTEAKWRTCVSVNQTNIGSSPEPTWTH